MGNTITFSETLIVALGGIAVVLAILVLYAISLVSKLSKMIIDAQSGNSNEQRPVESFASNAAPQNYAQSFNDSDDEEDRLVVALAASAMAASERSDSHFHISKITRIK